MNTSPLFFLTNSTSVAQALAFANNRAQAQFTGALSSLGLDYDDAEQLLNASIPNHIQKTHALALRFGKSSDWLIFLKKSPLSADLEPHWIPEVRAAGLGLNRIAYPLQWIELNNGLKNELSLCGPISMPDGEISLSLDVLLAPVCTLDKRLGTLGISLPFSRKASVENLMALTQVQGTSQYLGLEMLSKWMGLNQNRPASEQTALASIFKSISVETPESRIIELIQTHQILICSGTEPCLNDGRVSPEFVNPPGEVLESLRSQGLEASIVETPLLNATEMKEPLEMHFKDLLHLLETIPE